MYCDYCGEWFIPIKKGQRFDTPQCSKKYHAKLYDKRRTEDGRRRKGAKPRTLKKNLTEKETSGYCLPEAVFIPDQIKNAIRNGFVQPRVRPSS